MNQVLTTPQAGSTIAVRAEFPRAARIAAQVAALWLISAGGSWIAAAFHLPLPGNAIGLTLLFVALCSGAIRPEWLDLGGGLLTKHLAFFFVPVTVGLMGFGAIFARSGFAIVATLLVSAIAGLVAAGHVAQYLEARDSRSGER